ncbi:hypothetical protein KZW42_003983 [Escherichia coli]|uniref:hypothetical protein n=1 Tax=Escherichia coli TaxID=562 RepID=UPI000510A283|nr:hypothetical protein [Escherichia coli]EEW1923084.1 hypothetical protein [Escherichia coli]EFD0461830.1 hypothetical protein [Escherichia coli]EFD9246165.1 hypothetical protein [Escherichia coli]EFD9670797.1 hypothetical protein [Escherichia coli]EFL5889590.1 hypothetical protein [Escherichia coli]
MDIEITNPVNIKLDVIEFDEHVPSLKFSVSISVEKFGYKAEVNTHFWIECQCFDKFVSCMNCGELAILKDMNDSFELILNPVAGVLNWSCMKEDINDGISLSKGSEKLDDAAKQSILRAFNDYPKWW